MKCPSCGAETKGTVCEYCGTELQPQSQGARCANCGSTNITFKRENAGEIRGKKSKQIIHRTVGYCKDCGYTWHVSSDTATPKSKKTWLWVLGWICVFPLPLTILLLRKKNMKPAIKYAIIAIAWIFYLLIALSGNKETVASPSQQDSSPTIEEQIPSPDIQKELPAQIEDAAPTEGPVTPEGSLPTEASAPTDETKLSVDEIIALYETNFETNSMGSLDYSIQREDNIVSITVWSDGITQNAMAAKLSNDKSDWDALAASIVELQQSLQGVMNENGHGDIMVTVGVLNDMNKDNLLLYVGFGVVLYDAVNDINLLG